MKFNVVPTIISLALSALLAYAVYALNVYRLEKLDNPLSLVYYPLLYTVGSFFILATMLTCAIGMQFELPRTKTNIRVLSLLFFLVALTWNFYSSFHFVPAPAYIITCGILFLVFILLIYSIAKAKQ